MKDAVPERSQHVSDFDDMSFNLAPESVLKWTAEVESWEADNSQPNPFVILVTGMCP